MTDYSSPYGLLNWTTGPWTVHVLQCTTMDYDGQQQTTVCTEMDRMLYPIAKSSILLTGLQCYIESLNLNLLLLLYL